MEILPLEAIPDKILPTILFYHTHNINNMRYFIICIKETILM